VLASALLYRTFVEWTRRDAGWKTVCTKFKELHRRQYVIRIAETMTSFSLPELKGDVSKYHLNAIKFTNNKTLTNVEALRKLFPLRDGEPLDTVKLSEGLRNLKQAYGSQGFAAFSSVVQSTVNEKDHSVSVQVKCDEGRQFYVDHINLVGLDEHTFEEVKKNLFIKPATYTTKVSLNSRCVRILA
jgi:hypothetical protein